MREPPGLLRAEFQALPQNHQLGRELSTAKSNWATETGISICSLLVLAGVFSPRLFDASVGEGLYMVGTLTVTATLLAVGSVTSVRVPASVLCLPLVVLWVFVLLSGTIGLNPVQTRYLGTLPLSLIVGLLIGAKAVLVRVGRFYLAFCILASLLALVEYSLGRSIFASEDFTLLVSQRSGFRSVVFTDHPLELAALLAVGVGIALSCPICGAGTRVGFVLLSSAGIAVTGSRVAEAVVGLMIGTYLVVYVLSGRLLGPRSRLGASNVAEKVVAGISACYLLAVTVLAVTTWSNVVFAADNEAASGAYRQALLSLVPEILKSDPLGVGFGPLSPSGWHVYVNGIDKDIGLTVDSEPVNIALRFGIGGLIAFACICLAAIVALWKSIPGSLPLTVLVVSSSSVAVTSWHALGSLAFVLIGIVIRGLYVRRRADLCALVEMRVNPNTPSNRSHRRIRLYRPNYQISRFRGSRSRSVYREHLGPRHTKMSVTSISRLLDSPAVLSAGRVLGIVVTIIMAPILARGLAPSGRGLYASGSAWLVFVPVALGVGLPIVARRSVIFENVETTLGMIRLWSILTVVPGAMVGIATLPLLGHITVVEGVAYLVACGVSSLTVWWNADANVLFARRNFAKLCLVQLGLPVSFFLAVVGLFIIGKLSLVSVFLAWSVCTILTCVLSTLSSQCRVRFFMPSRKAIREGISYAPAQLADAAMFRGAVAIGILVLGSVDTGLFSIAVTVLLLSQSLSQTVSSNTFTKFSDLAGHDWKVFLGDVVRRTFVLGLLAGLVLSLFSYFAIPVILGQDYEPAVAPTLILLTSSPAVMVLSVVVSSLIAAGKARRVLSIQTIAVALSLLLFGIAGGFSHDVREAAAGISFGFWLAASYSVWSSGAVGLSSWSPGDLFLSVRLVVSRL